MEQNLHLVPPINKKVPPEGKFHHTEGKSIRSNLLRWYLKHRRHLPWRGDSPPYTGVADVLRSIEQEVSTACPTSTSIDKDTPAPQTPTTSTTSDTINTINTTTPYSSWVSEIMCQQTRVETVVKYHTLWMQTFPTIDALSKATEEHVNQIWAGLGYYRRARFLHKGEILFFCSCKVQVY